MDCPILQEYSTLPAATEYPTKYCVLEILRIILYHIEYSSDHTRGSAG